LARRGLPTFQVRASISTVLELLGERNQRDDAGAGQCQCASANASKPRCAQRQLHDVIGQLIAEGIHELRDDIPHNELANYRLYALGASDLSSEPAITGLVAATLTGLGQASQPDRARIIEPTAVPTKSTRHETLSRPVELRLLPTVGLGCDRMGVVVPRRDLD
jgi:hypothetical protein